MTFLTLSIKNLFSVLILIVIFALLISYFIAPLLEQPNVLFQKFWGLNTPVHPSKVVADSFGNIIVSGETFNSSISPDSTYPVLLKYDSGGNLVWIQAIRDPKLVWSSEGIATDASGSIYVTGYVSGFAQPFGIPGIFVLKLTSSGDLIWEKAWYSGFNPQGVAISVDASNNIYVAGASIGQPGWKAVLLMKLDSRGNLIWHKNWGGIVSGGNGLTVDNEGGVYVTGSAGDYAKSDILLLKFDSSGNIIWVDTWGASEDDVGYGVSAYGSGNIFVTGCTGRTGTKSYDGVLLKLNASGNLVWQKTWDSGGSDCSRTVATDAHGNVYAAGDSIDEGQTYAYDAFLLKFNPAGNLLWQNSFSLSNLRYSGSLTWGSPSRGTASDTVSGLALDPFGKLLVTGQINESSLFAFGTREYTVNTPSFQIVHFSNPKTDSYNLTLIQVEGQPIRLAGSDSYSGSEGIFLFKFSESSPMYLDATLVVAALMIPSALLASQRGIRARIRKVIRPTKSTQEMLEGS